MSEPVGPLKIDIHSDKLDIHVEIREPGGLKVKLDPFVEKFISFVQNAAPSFGYPSPEASPTAEDYQHAAAHDGPVHPHGDGYHVPTGSVAEMLRMPCGKCLTEIAEAVAAEQARRNAEMS